MDAKQLVTELQGLRDSGHLSDALLRYAVRSIEKSDPRFDWVGLSVARFIPATLVCAIYLLGFRRAESLRVLRAGAFSGIPQNRTCIWLSGVSLLPLAPPLSSSMLSRFDCCCTGTPTGSASPSRRRSPCARTRQPRR